jgi:hypothetical protein
VTRFREPSIGEWVGLLHTALRRKARKACSRADVTTVETPDLLAEVEVLRRTCGFARRPAEPISDAVPRAGRPSRGIRRSASSGKAAS